jgi:hypothetical protein
MAALNFTLTRDFAWVAMGIAAALLVGLLLWRALRREVPPEEVERRRRLGVNGRGKLGDGEVTEIEQNTLFYSYSVSGVSYTAAQDLFTIEELLPEDRMSAIGPVLIKFDPRNPANSIVICEEWSGFQRGGRNGRTVRLAPR